MSSELLNLSKLGVAQVNAGKAGARHTALVEARAVFDAAFNQLAALQATAYSSMGAANNELLAVATASPVALPNVGEYSQIDTLLRAERFAGKSAAIDYIKANPTCTEGDAEGAWEAAALVVTGLPALIVPVGNYSFLYKANLVKAGLIQSPTWEAQRDWIIATDKTVIMGA